MTDGIPIVYYGQEQGMHGNPNSYNRAIRIPEHHHRASHHQAQQTPTTDDQDGQQLPNSAGVYHVDYGNQHRHSKGIHHIRHH